jgi:hypothetical protein
VHGGAKKFQGDRYWRETELLDPTIRYERDGAELARRGLYVDLPRWRPTVFALTPAGR